MRRRQTDIFVPTGECLSQPEGKHLRSDRVRVDKEDVLVDLGQSLAPRSKREIEVGYKLERQEKEQKLWRALCRQIKIYISEFDRSG